MPLDNRQRRIITDFRSWVDDVMAADERFGAKVVENRDDESTLRDRWSMKGPVWCEVTLRPFLPQVRVGILTDDRWKSEEIEQAIEDSGDTMTELVELGLSEAGLNEGDPLVEHYRDQGKWFCFTTPYEPKSLEELAEPVLRDRVKRMIDGYWRVFHPLIG